MRVGLLALLVAVPCGLPCGLHLHQPSLPGVHAGVRLLLGLDVDLHGLHGLEWHVPLGLRLREHLSRRHLCQLDGPRLPVLLQSLRQLHRYRDHLHRLHVDRLHPVPQRHDVSQRVPELVLRRAGLLCLRPVLFVGLCKLRLCKHNLHLLPDRPLPVQLDLLRRLPPGDLHELFHGLLGLRLSVCHLFSVWFVGVHQLPADGAAAPLWRGLLHVLPCWVLQRQCECVCGLCRQLHQLRRVGHHVHVVP